MARGHPTSIMHQLFTLTILWYMIGCSSAFPPPVGWSRATRRKSCPPVNVRYFGDFEDLEETRAAFEDAWDTQRSAPSNLAHRRYHELELLCSLQESDAGIDQLLNLWNIEYKDRFDAKQLQETSHKSPCDKADDEKQLRELRQRYPDWAEPCIQLALLLFSKDRMVEAYELALEALELKPWHFATHQLFILLSLRQGNLGQALHWARLRLPPLHNEGDNRRRRIWVQRALEQAAERVDYFVPAAEYTGVSGDHSWQ